MASTVVFLRGLNTFGDDDLHIGPWIRLGPMDQYWRGALSASRRFVTVPDMGLNGPAEMARRAGDFLRRELAPQEKFHIVAHSTGILTARALLKGVAPASFAANCLSVVSVGGINQGSPAAEAAANPHFVLKTLAGVVGYDIDVRVPVFRELTPSAVDTFTKTHPFPARLPLGSIISKLPFMSLGWACQLVALQAGIRGELGDGFSAFRSQILGDIIFESRLDHFEQLGYSVRAGPARRRDARAEFARAIEAVENFWKSVEIS